MTKEIKCFDIVLGKSSKTHIDRNLTGSQQCNARNERIHRIALPLMIELVCFFFSCHESKVEPKSEHDFVAIKSNLHIQSDN